MFEPGAPFTYPAFHAYFIHRHRHPKIASPSLPKDQGKVLSPQCHSSGAHHKAHRARGREMVTATYRLSEVSLHLRPLKFFLTESSRNSFSTSTRPCRKEEKVNLGQKHQQDSKAISLHLTSVDVAGLQKVRASVLLQHTQRELSPKNKFRSLLAFTNEQTALAQVTVSVSSYV